LELDKDIIDLISDPIIHLIRNSLDHGIESKEVRVAAGKDPIGKIEISVFQDDGNVVFEVADDGHGLDHQKILKKAIEKNLIPSDSKLSNDEIGKLIFLPGFSTNDAVNEISGRGVGMDVVKSAVEDRAGGVVEIKSTLGKGSVFRLRLPPGIFLIDGAVLRN